ncbi:hypothetical protein [Pedobacter sp. NJ-S-72]
MKNIPLHILQDNTSLGLQIEKFVEDEPYVDMVGPLGAHRDDHYIFFLLKKGSGMLMIDRFQ